MHGRAFPTRIAPPHTTWRPPSRSRALCDRHDRYYALVDFVRPEFLGTAAEFSNQFVKPIAHGRARDATRVDARRGARLAHVLHRKLAGVVHRREAALLQQELPPKREAVLYVGLGALQKKMTRRLLHWLRDQREQQQAQQQRKEQCAAQMRLLESGDPVAVATGGAAAAAGAAGTGTGALFKVFQIGRRVWAHPDVLPRAVAAASDAAALRAATAGARGGVLGMASPSLATKLTPLAPPLQLSALAEPSPSSVDGEGGGGGVIDIKSDDDADKRSGAGGVVPTPMETDMVDAEGAAADDDDDATCGGGAEDEVADGGGDATAAAGTAVGDGGGVDDDDGADAVLDGDVVTPLLALVDSAAAAGGGGGGDGVGAAPSLVRGDVAHSGKMEVLLAILDGAGARGEKTLVFSSSLGASSLSLSWPPPRRSGGYACRVGDKREPTLEPDPSSSRRDDG